ncbi:MAG: cupin domain-containing protein [Rhodospirillales bacterium]|nr:cupin domain-containing protein [Rhodospirillales bacterium]
MDAKTPTAKSVPQDFAFSTSPAKDAEWASGLRDFFEYRDLGIAGATGGQFRAHVIRVRDGGDTSGLHTTGLHTHELGFQMIYVLKGWVKFVYHVTGEDGGVEEQEHIFGPGDCCLQPPAIVHNELECSDDLELIEITSPADYRTVALG